MFGVERLVKKQTRFWRARKNNYPNCMEILESHCFFRILFWTRGFHSTTRCQGVLPTSSCPRLQICPPLPFWETKPEMVSRDLNIGFQGLALIQGQIYNPLLLLFLLLFSSSFFFFFFLLLFSSSFSFFFLLLFSSSSPSSSSSSSSLLLLLLCSRSCSQKLQSSASKSGGLSLSINRVPLHNVQHTQNRRRCPPRV